MSYSFISFYLVSSFSLLRSIPPVFLRCFVQLSFVSSRNFFFFRLHFHVLRIYVNKFEFKFKFVGLHMVPQNKAKLKTSLLRCVHIVFVSIARLRLAILFSCLIQASNTKQHKLDFFSPSISFIRAVNWQSANR